MSLLADLVAYWRFEDAATSAADESGNGHTLTWNVSGRTPPGGAPSVGAEPQRTTGYTNYGLDLHNSYIWADPAAWNQLRGTSFTFAGWVKPHAPVNFNNVVLSQQFNYLLRWNDVTTKFDWTVYKQGGGQVDVSSPVVTRDTWHFVRVWLDLEGAVVGIQVDCGAEQTAAWSGNISDFTGGQNEFTFGRDGQSLAYAPHELDGWGLWTRVLTTSEMDTLCDGADYPFLDCGTITYGDYTFANTFHVAEDGVEWSPSMTPLARAHGGRALDFFLRPRRVLVRGGEIKGPFNTSDLRDRIDDIRAALAAQPAALWIDPDRYLRDVRVEYFRNPYGPTHYCRIAAEMEISFLARDPYRYGYALNTDTWSSPTDASTHSFSVGGNAPAKCEGIAFVVGGGGAQTIDWTLENTTTGEQFQLSGAVTGGQTITVNPLDQTVLIGTTNEISLFDGQFPGMDVGANTWQITVTAGSITSITFTWRSRWW